MRSRRLLRRSPSIVPRSRVLTPLFPDGGLEFARRDDELSFRRPLSLSPRLRRPLSLSIFRELLSLLRLLVLSLFELPPLLDGLDGGSLRGAGAGSLLGLSLRGL